MKKETKERIKAGLGKVESWLDAPAGLIHSSIKKKRGGINNEFNL